MTYIDEYACDECPTRKPAGYSTRQPPKGWYAVRKDYSVEFHFCSALCLIKWLQDEDPPLSVTSPSRSR